MNLLLLLSALLSALTGMGSTARPAQAPAAMVQAPARATLVAVVAIVHHPVLALPERVMSLAHRGAALIVGPIEPIYAARRRE